MAEMPDHEIQAPDLVAEVGAIVGWRGRAWAVSFAGDSVLRQYGVWHVLSIGIVNSGLEQRQVADRDALLLRVAQAGVAWLRRQSLLTPGTQLSIQVQREVDLRLVCWSWGVGGASYWIDDAGELTRDAPADRDVPSG